MSSDIDLEVGQVAQAAPPAGAFFRSFSLLSIPSKVLTVHEEGVGRVEMHEMDIIEPCTSSVASPLQSVSTGQDTNDGSQSVVSQNEGATSIFPSIAVSSRFFSVAFFHRIRKRRHL